MIGLIIKCNKCGDYNALNTNDLNKAQVFCKICGNTKKLKGKNGWNFKVFFPNQDESLTDKIIKLKSQNI